MTDKLEQIKKILASHFGLTDEYPDGTYLYQLNRVKSAFHVGTMTLDDFVEVDDEFLNEVFKAIKPVVEDLQKQIEQQHQQLQKVRENISETLEVLKRGGPGTRSKVQRFLEETLEELEGKK